MSYPGLILIAVSTVGVTAAAEIPSDPLDEFLRDIDSRVERLEAENRSLRSQLYGLTSAPGRVRLPNWDEHPIEFAGRIHIDWWTFPGDSPGVNAFETGSTADTPQDRLELRRARFAAFGDLPGQMEYKLDLELSEASNPEFRDLYIGWKDIPAIGGAIRFGNQKRPYGLDHLNSSNFNVFMERPLVVQAFNRNNRRFGAQWYGVSEDEAWNWRLGGFNLDEIQDNGVYISDHYQGEIAGRLARTIGEISEPSEYLHLAVSSSFAIPDGTAAPPRAINQARFRTEPEARSTVQWLDTGMIDGANRFGLVGLECVANYGPFQFTGEHLNLWLGRESGFGPPVHFHGGYAQVAWFLTDHYQPWNRKLGTIGRVRKIGDTEACPKPFGHAWQVAVRWSYADLSDDDVLGGVGQNVTAGVNWYWTRRARMQFNCIHGDIGSHFPVDGQTEGTFTALGTRVLIDF
ncbi:OprO/OprP family phosphate-selective porin [Stratiformator vulcanicus]|uniref:Phosphate-selective porin O and P n=1 Tax=Stratiformator vulcanicus TaxID=2527980 RepID=A0A517QYY9_9PLAN|nr:porin [Stratiformator vulcanicus]QDT36867.1 Phosphate-selective porin O and P [Stratiformator vulcanicus]